MEGSKERMGQDSGTGASETGTYLPSYEKPPPYGSLRWPGILHGSCRTHRNSHFSGIAFIETCHVLKFSSEYPSTLAHISSLN